MKKPTTVSALKVFLVSSFSINSSKIIDNFCYCLIHYVSTKQMIYYKIAICNKIVLCLGNVHKVRLGGWGRPDTHVYFPVIEYLEN